MKTGPEHPSVNDLVVAIGKIESYPWSTKVVPRMEPPVSTLRASCWPVAFQHGKVNAGVYKSRPRTEQRCTASTSHVGVVIEAA